MKSFFNEKFDSLDFWGCMIARLKLKVIDENAPPGEELVAQFDSMREILPG